MFKAHITKFTKVEFVYNLVYNLVSSFGFMDDFFFNLMKIILYPWCNDDRSRPQQNIKVRNFMRCRFLEFWLWLNFKLCTYLNNSIWPSLFQFMTCTHVGIHYTITIHNRSENVGNDGATARWPYILSSNRFEFIS